MNVGELKIMLGAYAQDDWEVYVSTTNEIIPVTGGDVDAFEEDAAGAPKMVFVIEAEEERDE